MGPLFQGAQVLGRKNIDPDRVELKVRMLLDRSKGPLPAFVDQQNDAPGISIETLVRENGQWKNKPVVATEIPNISEWGQSGDIMRYAN